MELWVIKTGSAYLRISGDSMAVVGLDKASVFPADQLERVHALQCTAKEQGFPDAAIFRLTLTETPL